MLDAPVSQALDTIRNAMREDPEYAWTWHCNIAMAAQDEGMAPGAANRAAARFMFNTFFLDVRDYEPSNWTGTKK